MSDPDLRILILSTPKTGNTWLRHLLGAVYHLPQFYLPPGFDRAALDGAGPRWVTHYHIRPNPELRDWIRANQAVVMTTIRHPGDVLLSLYHHVNGFRGGEPRPDFLRRMLVDGYERTNMTADWTGQPFSADLACSLEWMGEPGTHVIRYEDLRADTAGTLRALAGRIAPASEARIAAATEMCDLGLMRRMAGQFGGFFREGAVGAWRDLLPAPVVDILRGRPPYPEQIAALGYSLDAGAPPPAGAAILRSRHPVATRERFDNGVPFSPILAKCFFWTQPMWRDVAGFYGWLNAPSPGEGRGIYKDLPVSNLAAFIYGDRPDVRLTYPDLSGRHRAEYLQWFLRAAGPEYGLDAAFIDPVRAGMVYWGTSSSPIDDTARSNALSAGEGRDIYEHLPVSNLATFIYEKRPDVRMAYPDLAGRHRYEYLRWFVRAAGPEYGLGAAFINPVRAAMLRWANARSPVGRTEQATNFVLHICQTRTDVLGSFPHLQPLERRELTRSVVRAARALRLEEGYIAPLEKSLGRRWLPRPIRRWLRHLAGRGYT